MKHHESRGTAAELQGPPRPRRIAAALASLPVRCREALLLVAVEGLRPGEAAVICGTTAEAIRQRLSRARALLARRLADDDGPPLLFRGVDLVTPLDDLQDHLFRDLGRLPPLAPDPVRSTRVRAKCHAQLARSRVRPEQTAAVAGLVRRLLAPAVLLAGCALYVASIVSTVLRVLSLFQRPEKPSIQAPVQPRIRCSAIAW